MQAASPDGAIRERAYAIWESEGRPEGRDWEHWYQAMKEILGPPPARNGAAPAAKARPRKSTKGRIREALKSALS